MIFKGPFQLLTFCYSVKYIFIHLYTCMCSIPMALGTVSWWVPASTSLSRQNFVLLKFSVLFLEVQGLLLFARPVFLRVTNSTM